jgi:hypothetical protein
MRAVLVIWQYVKAVRVKCRFIKGKKMARADKEEETITVET